LWLGFIALIALLSIQLPLNFAFEQDRTMVWYGPRYGPAVWIAAYVVARRSLVFPATALGRSVSIDWSKNLTKRNGWRIAFLISFLPFLFSSFVGSYFEGHWLLELVGKLISFFLSAFSVIILSVCYHFLVVPVVERHTE
jgi:hypothetical protein